MREIESEGFGSASSPSCVKHLPTLGSRPRSLAPRSGPLKGCAPRSATSATRLKAELSTLARAVAKPAKAPPPKPATAGPPGDSPLAAVQFKETERQAHEYFSREYDVVDPGDGNVVDPVALARASNVRGFLRAEHETGGDGPAVDVVVCVHDALDDVRVCLWSVLHKTDRPFRLIVVNDGSDEPTTDVSARARRLRACGQPRASRSIRPTATRSRPTWGMRAATGDYIVLLNSDTIVTNGWLDRIVRVRRVGRRPIGILGPLSNAASHQSVPELRAEGAGRRTRCRTSRPRRPSPRCLSGALPARARASRSSTASVTWSSARCIDAIGFFDEENFAAGYCEENDFSIRAPMRGSNSRSSTTATSSTRSRSPSASRRARSSPSAITRSFSTSRGPSASRPRSRVSNPAPHSAPCAQRWRARWSAQSRW